MKIQVIINTKQLPLGVDLYGVQADSHESAFAKLEHAASRKGRKLDEVVFQWGDRTYYGQFLADTKKA